MLEKYGTTENPYVSQENADEFLSVRYTALDDVSNRSNLLKHYLEEVKDHRSEDLEDSEYLELKYYQSRRSQSHLDSNTYLSSLYK